MIRQFKLQALCSAIATIIVPNLVSAAAITIQTGDPQLPGLVSSIWRSPGGDVIHELAWPAQGNMSSSDLAELTLKSLQSIPGVDPSSVTGGGDRVKVNSTPRFDPLDGVLPGGSISLSTGTTAQESMALSSPDTSHATITAAGHFEPYYQSFQPATFTAGIVTDVGAFSATVSAQELNFQTDGPIICQALFQRLAPRAPQYGAQINFAGDRLEVYFDPAYTVTQGGIIFGSTSPSPGYSGTITSPPALLPGDFNDDGAVDAADYVVWRDGLGKTYAQEDYEVWRANFGMRIGNGTSLSSVPEPATLLMFLVAAIGIRMRHR